MFAYIVGLVGRFIAVPDMGSVSRLRQLQEEGALKKQNDMRYRGIRDQKRAWSNCLGFDNGYSEALSARISLLHCFLALHSACTHTVIE